MRQATRRWREFLGIALAVIGLLAAKGATQAQAPTECATGTFKPLFKAGCAAISPDTKLPANDTQPMRFELIQLSRSISFVQAIGSITPETPAEFARFLATEGAKASRDLALHSPSGDALAGMELGRAIRRARLNTSIGRTIPLEGAMKAYRYKEATCASACAYAFLGGMSRSYPAGASYSLDRAAAASVASVGPYVEEMGIDRRVLTEDMSSAPDVLAKEWRVVYDGSGLTTFLVEERRGKSVAAFDFTTRDHKYSGLLSCEDGRRAMTLLDLEDTLHPALRIMNQFPVEFDASGRKIFGTATYAGATDRGPGSVLFMLPALDEKSFSGSGLALTKVIDPQLPSSNRGLLEALAWGDAESAFLFRVVADNGERVLGPLFKDCPRA